MTESRFNAMRVGRVRGGPLHTKRWSMADERLGVPLKPEGMGPVTEKQDDREPGLGWVLSDSAKRKIESVEENLRTAEQRTGSVILR